MKIQNAMSLVLAAGMVAPAIADTDSRQISTKMYPAIQAGSIYINAATNERVMSLKDGVQQQTAARGTEPLELWVQDNGVPCAQFDPAFAAGFVTTIDDVGGPFGNAFLDWGDVGSDTVVDGFAFSWAAQEPVAATGDSVPGLDALLIFSDADNGFGDCFRTELLQITIGDMPGTTVADPLTQFQVFEVTIDLVGEAVMELGDTDNDGQGADFFTPNSFADNDLDGLHDWSYTIRPIQPSPTSDIVTAVSLDAPRGEFTDLNTYVVDQTFPGGTPGSEDAWDSYSPTVDPADALSAYTGSFWFGGLSCDADGNGVFGSTAADYAPWGGFFFALYGPEGIGQPGEPCPDDFNGDGSVNFNDLVAFLGAFNSQDPSADLNGDSAINFNDLVAFLGFFNNGCP